MAKRSSRGTQLIRGFRLGVLYAHGEVLTSARIRSELGVSRATAKRDMRQIAEVVKVTPSKAKRGQQEHFARMAVR